jgi:hypothetical protein
MGHAEGQHHGVATDSLDARGATAVIGWLRDGALYVERLDAGTLRRAEDREVREREAQSGVVRPARVEQTHRAFWTYVASKAQPTGRCVPFQRGRG